MVLRDVTYIVILSLVCKIIEARKLGYQCPIGFEFAKNAEADSFCYRLKGPENFQDKYANCAGNLYSYDLYRSLITNSSFSVWADYKNLYPDGPFVEWSFSKTHGKLIARDLNVTSVGDPRAGETLCVRAEDSALLTASCDEQHYRYCIVKPYDDEEDMEDQGCGEDYYRFSSPAPTCLTAVRALGGGTVRSNWRQSKELCASRGGLLLNKGWRYANHDIFAISSTNPTFPMALIYTTNNTVIRSSGINNTNELIPVSEWHFANTPKEGTNNIYGALRNDFWYLVNSTYLFYNVVCEKSVPLRHVMMNVTIDMEGKIILSVNDTVDKKNIYCYTDSTTYHPEEIDISYDEDSNLYVLKPKSDGYYWCIHTNSNNFYVSESNRELFIREKQSLVNFYAVKLIMKPESKTLKLQKLKKYLREQLGEYIFYRTKYVRVFGEFELTDAEKAKEALEGFQATHPGLRYKESEVVYKMELKRYAAGQWVLVHAQLSPEMMPPAPGLWKNLSLEFMKPVYYCKGLDSVPMLPLGASTTSADCSTFSCIGDFTEGVQWLQTGNTPGSECSRNRQTLLKTTAEIQSVVTARNEDEEDLDNTSEEVTYVPIQPPPPPPPPTTSSITVPTISKPIPNTTKPTSTETVSTVTMPEEVIVVTTSSPPPWRPPDQQLAQVMEDLELLLQNDSVPISVSDVSDTFDQVDNLLDVQEELEIPGNLLHLLDKLGSRIDLRGDSSAVQIRSNVALLLADADPLSPVRGLRIAARDDDAFTENAFEIISENINSTHFNANQSEAVVQLPDSISNATRRISFVVFRNDRAFHNNHTHYSVNSRILSINVENLTQFDEGETVDIHLNPMVEQPESNMSRTCAYWRFLEDGSGQWATDGCVLVRSAGEGVLDICRCNHLTHFAEILVPRTAFSERNEDVLEVLTIIGCLLSVFGLLMVGVTAVLFRSWRRDYSNKIWMQLCVAIFILVICFLVIIFARFDSYDIPCMIVGVMLHYSVLASFSWMVVAAVLSYRRLVIVFSREGSHKLLRASAFAWGAPCAVVGILLSVDPQSYAGRFDEKTPSGAFCYPSGLGLWLAVYAPIALVLLANWTLFILIVRSVFASKRIQRHGDSNEAIRCASVSCVLVFLFGLPWVFGLFASNIVAAYLFTLTATFQGFVLFLIFVVGNKKTRDLWLNKLKIKQTRKVPVTSSTYTNRSNVGGSRRDPEGASSETNSSKPRSLASPDNSRFS